MVAFDGTFILPPPPMRFNYCLGPPPIKSNYQPTPTTHITHFFLESSPFKELEEYFSHFSLYLNPNNPQYPIWIKDTHRTAFLRRPTYRITVSQKTTTHWIEKPTSQTYSALPSKTLIFFSSGTALTCLYSWAGRLESYLVANPQRQVFSWHGSYANQSPPMPLSWHSTCKLTLTWWFVLQRLLAWYRKHNYYNHRTSTVLQRLLAWYESIIIIIIEQAQYCRGCQLDTKSIIIIIIEQAQYCRGCQLDTESIIIIIIEQAQYCRGCQLDTESIIIIIIEQTQYCRGC